uniref:Uncharacterized protein n=1 Tax=Parascaris equorum TaxID=6256 RepID=A0A914RT49_PAREQ
MHGHQNQCELRDGQVASRTRISSAIVLPFAAVIGTVGYFMEKQLSSRPKSIPYLDTSVHDDRMRRQMEVAFEVVVGSSNRLLGKAASSITVTCQLEVIPSLLT